MSMVDTWKKIVSEMNTKGIPVPMARDPKTKEGSVSLSLVAVSALLVVIGIVGKWSGKLGGIDMGYAMQFFWTACSLYWGRKFQSKSTPIDEPSEEEPLMKSK
jgi:hypothetical protein